MRILPRTSRFKNVSCSLLFNPEILPEQGFLSWLAKKHCYRSMDIFRALATLEERLISQSRGDGFPRD